MPKKYFNNKKNTGSKNNNSRNNNNNYAKNKTIYKFEINTKTNQVTKTFDDIQSHILGYIQKTFDGGRYVVEQIKNPNRDENDIIPPPVRNISEETELSKREMEQEGFDMNYKIEYEIYRNEVKKHKDNMFKAYTLIIENYCSTGLKNRIEGQEKFKDEIENKPHKLMELIKSLVRTPNQTTFCMVSLVRAFKRFATLRQQDDESLTDWNRRFKQERDIFAQMMGDQFLNEFIDNSDWYKKEPDTDKKNDIKAGAFDTFTATAYLMFSDYKRYGSIEEGLRKQFSLKNDQYPKTLSAMHEVLLNHRVDNAGEKKKQKQEDNKKKKEEKNTEKEDSTSSFAQKETKHRCYICGNEDHYAPECPKRDKIPQKDWAINTKNNLLQKESEKGGTSNNGDRFSGLQLCNVADEIKNETEAINLYSNNTMKNGVCLDSGSSLHLFCNDDLVKNRRLSTTTINLETNTGERSSSEIADVPGIDEPVRFDSEAMANIFGLYKLTKTHRVTFDNRKENAFIVHHNDSNKVTKFKPYNGIYMHFPKQEMSNLQECTTESTDVVSTIDTVANNRKHYTKRQYERAKEAYRLYHVLNGPSFGSLKKLFQTNAIKDNPFNQRDLEIAEDIFGKARSTIQGKSTRKTPTSVITDIVDIPDCIYEKHHEIELCIDTMFINGIPFLMTIDKTIKYRCCMPLRNLENETYFKALDHAFRLYNPNFKIKIIHCDGAYSSMMDLVADELDVEMIYYPRDNHVPEIERCIRTVKECYRKAYHRLPFNKIPRTMIQFLAMECTKKLNFFPVKGGVSEYFSPHMILNMQSINYNDHLKYEFGTYVQASHPTTNANSPRAIDAIYLRPRYNEAKGHEVFHLATSRVVVRNTVTPLPMTESVIELVHRLADRDGIQDLKFNNKMNIRLRDADLLAGVDYIDTIQNDENYDIQTTDDGLEAEEFNVNNDTNNDSDNFYPENIEDDGNNEDEDEESEDEDEDDDDEDYNDDYNKINYRKNDNVAITEPEQVQQSNNNNNEINESNNIENNQNNVDEVDNEEQQQNNDDENENENENDNNVDEFIQEMNTTIDQMEREIETDRPSPPR